MNGRSNLLFINLLLYELRDPHVVLFINNYNDRTPQDDTEVSLIHSGLDRIFTIDKLKAGGEMWVKVGASGIPDLAIN